MEKRCHKRAYFKVTWDHTNYLNWVIKYAKQKSHWESEADIDIVEYGVVEKGDDNQKLVGWPTGWWWWWRVIVTRWGGLSGLIAGPVQQHNTLMKHRCVCVPAWVQNDMTEEWWCFMRMYSWWTRINALESIVIQDIFCCERLSWKKIDLVWMFIP